jgi:8-hydroxy-5-deazaflavin:NADPH oxidoreductase
MKIGIIGAGSIGRAFAKHAAAAGHEVVLSNRRGPASLEGVVRELSPRASAATVREAAAAGVVFLSVPWKEIEGAVVDLPPWEGRIVIDPSNAIVFPDFRPADLGGKTSTEIVVGLLPGARVVKAFNTLPAAVLAADPGEAGGHRVIWVSGDDAESKASVVALVESLGFAAVDLGSLAAGGRLQQFGGPLPNLNLVKLSLSSG